MKTEAVELKLAVRASHVYPGLTPWAIICRPSGTGAVEICTAAHNQNRGNNSLYLGLGAPFKLRLGGDFLFRLSKFKISTLSKNWLGWAPVIAGEGARATRSS